MKRANGQGTIVKLAGNRRRPYAIRKVIGWKEDGKPILKYISYHRTYREAEKALNEFNNDPYTISRRTLREVYEEWYAMQESKKAESTLRGYGITFKHMESLHDVRVNEIDRYVLQRFYDGLNISGGAMRNIKHLLNMLFDYAVKRGIMPSAAVNLNKAVIIPDREINRQAPRSVIDRDTINKLWEMKEYNEYAKIALVYIYTGLRFSELYNLKPEECHENYIEITHAKTPSGVRIVPLSDKVQSLLPIIKVPTRNTLDRHFRQFMPDHVIHDCRHTFITMMTEAGVDQRVIKAIVGHRTNDVTEVYTHIGLDVMLEAVNRL